METEKRTDSIKCAGHVAAGHGAPVGFLKCHFSTCHIVSASNEVSLVLLVLARRIYCRVLAWKTKRMCLFDVQRGQRRVQKSLNSDLIVAFEANGFDKIENTAAG